MLVYDPNGASGNRSIRATLGEESVVLDLRGRDSKPKARPLIAGMLVVPAGGHHAKVYLDDLKYTAGRAAK